MNAQTLPVLTEVLQAPTPQASGASAVDVQARMLAQLPELVQVTIESMRPQFEQALMDALLPRVLALLEDDGKPKSSG